MTVRGWLLLLGGCRSGQWSLQVDPWPVVPRPATVGCLLDMERVLVSIEQRALVNEDGSVRSDALRGWVVDVWSAERTSPSQYVTRPRYAALEVVVAPPGSDFEGEIGLDDVLQMRADGAGIWVEGSIRCERTVRFSWKLPGPLPQRCALTTLDVPRGPRTDIGWAVAPHALFAGGLDAPLDAPPVLTAWMAADADQDGDLTLEELASAPLVGSGLAVSGGDLPDDMASWLFRRSERIGGAPEGWCSAL